MNAADLKALEALIDKFGLAAVLRGTAVICAEKADHLRANWQDDWSANVWWNASKQITRLAERHPITNLPA